MPASPTRVTARQIDDLVEAHYHFWESRRLDEAAEVMQILAEPLLDSGRYADLLHMLEQVLDSMDPPDSRLAVFHARALLSLGRHEEALAELEYLEFAVKNDPALHAAVLIDKSTAMRRLGYTLDSIEIIKNYRTAFEIFTKLTLQEKDTHERLVYRENQAACLVDEAAIYLYFLGNPLESREKYLAALKIYEDVGSKEGTGLVHKQLGEIYGFKRYGQFYNPVVAEEHFYRALSEFKELKSRTRLLETLYQLAKVHREDLERSLGLFQECHQLASDLGLLREEAITSVRVVEIQVMMHERSHGSGLSPEHTRFYFGIMEVLERSSQVLQNWAPDTWSRRVLADSYYLQGRLWLKMKAPEEAENRFRASLEICLPTMKRNISDDRDRRMKAVLRLMEIQLIKNRPEDLARLFVAFRDDFAALEIPVPDQASLPDLIHRFESDHDG
jgi:tetratricopeptide (TPR) repeat protein